MNQITDSELKNIEPMNRFVSKYFGDKPLFSNDLGLNGKLRWLMVIQAIRYHTFNAYSNRDAKKQRYLCAYDCLVKKKFTLCFGDYINHKDEKMNEKSDAMYMLFGAQSFKTAKYIIYDSSDHDIFSFIGKLMHFVPTRGGKIFHYMIALMLNNASNIALLRKVIDYYEWKIFG